MKSRVHEFNTGYTRVTLPQLKHFYHEEKAVRQLCNGMKEPLSIFISVFSITFSACQILAATKFSCPKYSARACCLFDT